MANYSCWRMAPGQSQWATQGGIDHRPSPLAQEIQDSAAPYASSDLDLQIGLFIFPPLQSSPTLAQCASKLNPLLMAWKAKGKSIQGLDEKSFIRIAYVLYTFDIRNGWRTQTYIMCLLHFHHTCVFLHWIPDGVHSALLNQTKNEKCKTYAPGNHHRFRKQPNAFENRYQTKHTKEDSKAYQNKLNNQHTYNCQGTCTPREPPERNKTFSIHTGSWALARKPRKWSLHLFRTCLSGTRGLWDLPRTTDGQS